MKNSSNVKSVQLSYNSPRLGLLGLAAVLARRGGTDAQPRAPHAAVVTVAQLRDGASAHKDSTYLMRGRRVPVAPPT